MLLKPKKLYRALSVSSKVSPKRGLLLAGFTPTPNEDRTPKAPKLTKSVLVTVRGFTLIELLVVIVIITILASVLLITFKGVDERAKLSNLIQFSQSQRTAFFNEMVGWWPFDELVAEGASTTTIDNSFQRNNGVVQGGVKVAKGIINSALEFNGVDSYVSIPSSDSLNLTDAVTLSAWVKLSAYGTNQYRGIISKKSPIVTNGCQVGYGLVSSWGSGTDVWFGLHTEQSAGDCGNWVQANTTLSLNKYYYVVGTYDSTTGKQKIYIDGFLKNTRNWPVGTKIKSSIGTVLEIGRNHNNSWIFNGLIDEVQIYNRVLPLAVVQQHYAEGLKRHQNLAQR